MSPTLVAFLIYRGMSFISGCLIIYWGYRLFDKGIFSDAGEIDGKFGSTKILLKKAAPGTFFALFGSLIILLSIHKASYEFDKYSNQGKIQERNIMNGVEGRDDPATIHEHMDS